MIQVGVIDRTLPQIKRVDVMNHWRSFPHIIQSYQSYSNKFDNIFGGVTHISYIYVPSPNSSIFYLNQLSEIYPILIFTFSHVSNLCSLQLSSKAAVIPYFILFFFLIFTSRQHILHLHTLPCCIPTGEHNVRDMCPPFIWRFKVEGLEIQHFTWALQNTQESSSYIQSRVAMVLTSSSCNLDIKIQIILIADMQS